MRELLELMQAQHSDFTLTFRRLWELAIGEQHEGDNISAIFDLDESFDPWVANWRRRFANDPIDISARLAAMQTANPVFIPRNHLVEEAIVAAEGQQDFKPFHKLVDVMTQPFEFEATHARFARPPQPGQEVTQTFCGT